MKALSRILLVRPDSIGDFVLFTACLPHLRQFYAGCKISLLLQSHILPLAKENPHVDQLIRFDKERFNKDRDYSTQLMQRLRNKQFDLAIYPVFSREPLGDFITLACGAKETITQAGDSSNMPEEMRLFHNQQYTQCITIPDGMTQEAERNRWFLGKITERPVDAADFKMELFPDEDEAAKNQDGYLPESFVALAPFAQNPIRHWPLHHWGELIAHLQEPVVILGQREHRKQANEIISRIPKKDGLRPILNLCGKISLGQTTVILKKAKQLIGVESGLAHVASALGVPNVVITGGGHFGRFVPSHPLQQVVYKPMDCFGCNWHCRYEKAHCIQDIQVEDVLKVVRGEASQQTITIPADMPWQKAEKLHGISWYHMGSWYKALKNWEKAVLYFEKALQFNSCPDVLGGAWFHLGEIHLTENRHEQAEEALLRCLEYLPAHKKAKAALDLLQQEKQVS